MRCKFKIISEILPVIISVVTLLLRLQKKKIRLRQKFITYYKLIRRAKTRENYLASPIQGVEKKKRSGAVNKKYTEHFICTFLLQQKIVVGGVGGNHTVELFLYYTLCLLEAFQK